MNQPEPQAVDVLVVGAGPIGLAAAIAMRQTGLTVTVIERGHGPQDKACGEGIMPAGVDALRQLEIEATALPGWPLAGIRYLDGPYSAQGSFPQGAGWGMRRPVLVAALKAQALRMAVGLVDRCAWQNIAQAESHVDVQTDKGLFRAKTLVAADGLHSSIRNHLSLNLPQPTQRRRFGVRQHFACAPWSPFVDVHWAPGAEAYVTPVGPHCVGVAFLWGPKPARFESLLQEFPALKAKLQGVKPVSSLRGAGRLAQPVMRRHLGRIVLIGDAAGYLDALTGEGLTLGFLCALALAPLVRAGRPLEEYESAYKKLSQPYYREAHWLLALASRPRLRRWAIRLMASYPRIMQAFIAAHSARRFVALRDFFPLLQRLWRTPANRLSKPAHPRSTHG
jgi:flavin-dependent dehydrogenase